MGLKDTVRLRDLYWRTGIAEYWLVDVRKGALSFEILRRTASGFESVEHQDGWLPSAVLGRAFRLIRQADPMGIPRYVVEMRQLSK